MSRREKKFIIIFLSIIAGWALLTLMSLLMLRSCMKAIDSPFVHYNVRWTSSDPKIVFTINSEEYYNKTDKDGHRPDKEGYLMVGEEMIKVSWTSQTYKKVIKIYRLDDHELLIEGRYVFDFKKGSLRMKVDIDNIYGQKYDEISFTMTKLD